MSHEESAASGHVRLELHIRRVGQLVEGTCREQTSGMTREFWGWLELISVLETSAAGADDPARQATGGRPAMNPPFRGGQ